MATKKTVFNLEDKINALKETQLLKSAFKRHLKLNKISIDNDADLKKALNEFKKQPVEVK